MPFHFAWFCELLEELDRNRHKSTLTAARTQNHDSQTVSSWYQRYGHRIDRSDVSSVAFLSSLFPERRPDRTYGLQANRLSQVFGRALGLGCNRASELNRWRDQDGADFPTCVERTLQQCENEKPVHGKEVTLEEIDEILDLIAARSPSSSIVIRSKYTAATPAELLAPVLQRLKSTEAKWLARLLLKSYAPVQIPEYQALHGFHFMLPKLLNIQNSFVAAIAVLNTEAIRQLPPRPDKNYEFALQPLVSEHVQPKLGVMVRRQPYYKARSIQNCYNLASSKQMSIERKYDGEYCQIHIDVSQGFDCIQIFSKSGRDSTSDRVNLHGAIKDALRINRTGCKIRERCIVEGELLVWNNTTQQIQPFHKIRKYVKHGGRTIGTARDSPPRRNENLMIAFYDILLLDDLILLTKSHRTRRQYLKTVVEVIAGRSVLCERQIIDFRSSRAKDRLREVFAQSITQRWEGLVLKALNEPYFAWANDNHGIKLKKDYITGLGDVADLCIVGGRRDPQVELQIGQGQVSWTSFYIGAVTNMSAMSRFGARPQIKIVDVLTHHSMPHDELLDLNGLGRLRSVPYSMRTSEYDVEVEGFHATKPTDLFTTPFIVEIMGAGFEKPSNSSFFTLRFPRKIDGKFRLHMDRTLLDTTSFDDLQTMAERTMNLQIDNESQEDAKWIERLIKVDGKSRDTRSVSPETEACRTPKSASVICLSPTNRSSKTSPRVFIRPDTEEPDLQVVSSSAHVTQSTDDPSNHLMESATPDLLLEQGRQNQTPSKRDCDALSPIKNNKTRTKRNCLRNRELHERKEIVLTSDIDTSTPASNQFTMTKTQNKQEHVADMTSTQAKPNAFEPPAEFLNPHQLALELDYVEETPGNTPSTPDSTLVMRQLMSMDQYQAYGYEDFSPTKPATCKISEQPQPAKQHIVDARISQPAPTFPTPPLSSSLDRLHEVEASQTHERPHTQPTTTNRQLESLQPSKPQRSLSDMNQLSRSTGTHPACGSVADINNEQSTSSIPQEKTYTPPQILVLNTKHSLLDHLPNIKAAFTFSVEHFFDVIDASTSSKATTATACADPTNSKSNHHMILIDLHNPETVADSFETMAYTLQRHLDRYSPVLDLKVALEPYKDKILLFDHNVLSHDLVVENNSLGLNILRRLDYANGHGKDATLFCGVLELRSGCWTRRGRRGDEKIVDTGGDGGQQSVLRIGLGLDYNFSWLKG